MRRIPLADASLRSTFPVPLAALALLFAAGTWARTAGAQSAAWTATLLLRPNPSPFIADWQRDPRAATLQVLHTGASAQDYVLEATVRSSTRGDLATVRSPMLAMPPGPATQFFTSADVLDWETVAADRATIDLVQRSGVLPEGEYQVCVTARTLGGATLFVTCERFTIALPEPPQLIFPTNGGVTIGAQPAFQWTPVLAAPEVGLRYRVTIVERRPQQAPQVALDANRPWHEADVDGAPLLLYPIDALPLRVGQEYVWRVVATDALGRPVTREQRASEIWSFVAGDATGGTMSALVPDTLDLVPGLVRVLGVRAAQVSESELAFTVSGALTMEILAPFRASFPVTATDLRLDRAALPVALVKSGTVAGRIPRDHASAAGAWLGPWVQMVDVAYDARKSLLVGLGLRLPPTASAPDQVVSFGSRVLLTTGGFTGATAVAVGMKEPPTLKGDASVVALRQARLSLPGPYLSTAWDVGVFGAAPACASALALVEPDGRVHATFDCAPAGGPVAMSATPVLRLERIAGALGLDLTSGAVAPDLAATMALQLRGERCEARFTATVARTGVGARGFSAQCAAGEGDADFGWLRARLGSLALERFSWQSERGFDFRVVADLEPLLPAAPALRLPTVPTVAITQDGVAVPAMDVLLSPAEATELAGFAVRLSRVRLPAFTLSWDEWRLGRGDRFRFGVDLAVTMPRLPGASASCIATRPLGVASAELAEGRLRVSLADTRFTPACALDLSATLAMPRYAGDDEVVESDAGDTSLAGDPTQWAVGPGTELSAEERKRLLEKSAADHARREAEREKARLERLRLRYPTLAAADEYEKRERARVEAAIAEARRRVLAGDESAADIGAIIAGARHDWHVNVVRPRLIVAASNCLYLGRAMSGAVGVDRQAEFTAADETPQTLDDRAEVMALYAKANTACGDQAFAACTRAVDQPAAAELFRLEVMRYWLDIPPDTTRPQLAERVAQCRQPDARLAAAAEAKEKLRDKVKDAIAEVERRQREQPQSSAWAYHPAQPGSIYPPTGPDTPGASDPIAAFYEYLRSLDTVGTLAVRMELERVHGQLVLAFDDPFANVGDLVRVERVPEVDGAIILPDLFSCADAGARRQSVAGRLRLGPYGGVDGLVTPLVPACTVSLAGVELGVTQSALRFSTAAGAQSLLLAAGVRGNFAVSAQPLTGTGSVTLDLLRRRMVSGNVHFQGPVSFDLPRAAPLLSFQLASLGLDRLGVHVDGRAQLALAGGQAIGSTFDSVTIDPRSAGLVDGRILFDTPFALEAGITTGALGWKAVPVGAALSVGTGVRADLPAGVTVTPLGVVATGAGQARLIYDGRDLDRLSSTFSDDFVMGWGPAGVRDGRVDFRRDGADVGYIDASGFHPEVGFVANAVLPARLPLPSQQVAWLELRDARDSLRVRVQRVQGGVRITTPAGTTLPLVMPALDLGRGVTPTLQVAVDLTLAEADLRPLAGAIHAGVPLAQRAAFDLSTVGLPVAFDTLAYEAKGGAYRFTLGGGLQLFGARQKGAGLVELTLDGSGRLQGTVSVSAEGFDPVPLVATSQLLTLDIQAVRGSFSASLPTRELDYTLDIDGGIDLELRPGSLYSAVATLHMAGDRVEVRQVTTASSNFDGALDFEGVRLRLSNLRVPRLSYDHSLRKFDFELLLDAAPQLAQFPGLVLPPIKDIALRESGFAIPAWTVPELARATTTTYNGFVIKPLAVRSQGVTYDWFRGRTIGDWGLRFDLELSWDPAKLGPTTPAWVRDLKLSVLDAGISNGYVVGTIVQREVQQAYKAGRQLAIAVENVYGCLTDPTKQQSCADARAAQQAQDSAARAHVYERREPKVDVHFRGTLTFGLGPACVNGGSQYQVPLDLNVRASGGIEGSVGNVVPPCRMDLGVGLLTPGPSSLVVASYTDSVTRADGTRGEVFSDSVNVFLRTQANVRLPGPGGPADSVSFTGLLSLELFNRPRIVDGFIGLDAPLRLDFPRVAAGASPLVTFVADRGRLDRDGLRVSGAGTLRTADGATATADFTDFTLGFGDAGVTAGRARILSQIALTATIAPAGLQWRATSPQAARPAGSAFRITLPDTAFVDQRGLALGGGANAQLEYGDSVFATLAATFREGFAIGFAPGVRVREGRADLVANGRTIAYVTRDGFFPGDVFGVAPLPARLGLPTEDVAYVELRGADGQPLVETANEATGIRLSTRAGQQVRLVVPALKGTAAQAPSVLVDFSVAVNRTSYQVMSGEVRATAASATASLLDLAEMGIPARVRRMGFGATDDGYAFTMDARLALPGALAGLAVDLREMRVTAAGVSGTMEAGSYSVTAQPLAAPIATARLREQATDTLDVEVTGVRATLVPGSANVAVSGRVRSSLFAAPGSARAPLHFTAQVSPAGFVATVDPAQLPGTTLPIAVATFEPQSLGGQPAIRLTATAQEFAVRMSGTVRVPALGPQFGVTVQGLEVGTNGIVIPAISTSGGAALQVAQLFGARLELRDSVAGGSTVYPAVRFERAAGVLTLETTGAMTLLGSTARFYGLRVGTDGRVSLAHARLIDRPLTIVPDVLTLDELTVQQDTLRAQASVTLPAPLDASGGQKVFLRIAPDGGVSGGGTVVAINEAPGLSTAQTKLQVGPVLTAHLRYLALTVDAAALLQNSNVVAVADLYLQNDAANLIQVGAVNGGSVTPGLTVHFDRAPSWGSVTLAKAFTFDFDVLKVGLSDISASPTPNGALGLAFNGSFALDLPAVSGGLSYEDFRVTSDGKLDLDSARVTGGEVAVAGAARFQLSSFRYSTTPTTITASGGEVGDQATQAEKSQAIPVSSYLRFGGSIDVAGVFAGGVDTFFVYRAANDGKVNVIVRNAQLAIQGVVSAQGDLVFRQMPNDGFEFTVGARGSVVQAADVALVGTIGKEADLIRVGLFVAAKLNSPGSGLVLAPPPGPPIVVITGLGGGIFLNPKPEHITLVKKYAGVQGKAGALIAPPQDAAFAVMLYGAAGITPARVIEGQLLVTATNTEIQLDGTMTALSQGDRLEGEAHLALRWGAAGKSASAQGAFGLGVDYGPVVRTVDAAGNPGVALLEFSVFDPATWSIDGNAKVKLVSVLDADARLAVGPFGFYADAAIQPPAAIPLVEFRKMDAATWYKASTGQWGMKVEADVTANVLVASAGAFLQGALVGQGTAVPYVYGIAGVRADWPGGTYEGSVWAKMSEAGIVAGLGHDPAMEQLIADASDVMGAMKQSSESAQAAVAESRMAATAIAFTPQELAAAYARVAGWSWPALAVLAMYQERELQGATTADSVHHALYGRALVQRNAPTDTAAMLALASEVATTTAQLDARRAGVTSALARLSAQLAPAAAASIVAPPDPVRTATFVPVRTDSQLVGGYWVKRVVPGTGPVIDIDATAAQQAAQLASEQEVAAAASDARLRTTLDTLESLLARTRAATTATTDSSFLQYARLSGRALSAAERQFAMQADYLQRRRDWFHAYRDSLAATEVVGLDAVLRRRMRAWSTGGRPAGWALAQDRFDALRLLVTAGVPDAPRHLPASFQAAYDAHLGALPPSMNSADKQLQMNLWLATQGDTLGRQLWYWLGRHGTTALADSTGRAVTALVTQADTRLGGIREAHAALSDRLAGIYAQQADLTGLLHDLHGRALVRGRASGASDTLALVQRQAALATALRVPTVGSVTVTERRGRYMSQLDFAWSGAHAAGVYEYAFRDVLPTPGALEAPMLSVGGLTTFSSAWFRIAPPPSAPPPTSTGANAFALAGVPIASTPQHTLEVRARGGAGFTGLGRAVYRTATDPVAPTSPPSVVVGQQLPDATPPGVPTVSFPSLAQSPDGAAWSRPADRLLVSWAANDAESGVGGYEYAVVAPQPQLSRTASSTTATIFSTVGGPSPVAATAPDALAGYTIVRPWTEAGGRTTTSIEGLALAPGAPLVVAVRARNGAATATSAVGFSPPVRADATPPTFAVATGTLVVAAPASASSVPVQHYPACAAGTGDARVPLPWTGSLARSDGSAEAPTREIGFPAATDGESGVAGYAWRVDTMPMTSWSASGWQPARAGSVLVTGAPLDYARRFYLSVVAMSRAGMPSAPWVAGSFTVADRTPPSGAEFCATATPVPGSTDVQLVGALRKPALDRETGIVRYEYRVRSAAGAMVRDWPSAGQSTLAKGDGAAPDTRDLRSAGLPLVDGTAYMLDVRAVNGHGGSGNVTSSGPVMIDRSAPPAPTVAATLAPRTPVTPVAYLRLAVAAPNDPQTGLAGVEYAIGTGETTTDVKPWTPLASWSAGTFSTSVSLVAVPPPGATWWIQLRTRNAAGGASTIARAAFPTVVGRTVACSPAERCE